MIAESRHVGVTIDRPAGEVYGFVSDPANLPAWAAGLNSSMVVRFADRNEWGVADHEVRLPSGEWFHNPLRVIRNGEGSDVVFTVRRQEGLTDADFERDVAAVTADLARLKRVLER